MFFTRKERAEAQSAENYFLFFFLLPVKCLIIITNKNTNTITSPNTTTIAEPNIAPNIAILTNAKIAVNTNNVNKIIIVPPYNKNINMFSL